MNRYMVTTAATIAAGLILHTPAPAAPNNVNLTIVGSGAISKSVTKPPISVITGGSMTILPMSGELPGQVAIMPAKGLVSARDGGHHSIDALTTSATAIGPNERFTVEKIPDYTLFKTRGGYYVTAAGGDGGGAQDDKQTTQTEATVPTASAMFSVHPLSGITPGTGPYTLQTYSGYYLTAVGGGDQSTSAFHSDATTASSWEGFNIVQCGDLGDGYSYVIREPGAGYLSALNGGGLLFNALLPNYNLWARFRFLRQDDGSYALQTSNGVNYVSAINGGGLAHGTATSDNLVTTTTQVGTWGRFRIVDQGNCTYTIQTYSGYFVAFSTPKGGSAGYSLSTDISDPAAAPSVNYSAYFLLSPVWN